MVLRKMKAKHPIASMFIILIQAGTKTKTSEK